MNTDQVHLAASLETARTRDVAGIRRFLTPQQMAEEIVRLDAVIAGQAPNILMGRMPPDMSPAASLVDEARDLIRRLVDAIDGNGAVGDSLLRLCDEADMWLATQATAATKEPA